MTTQPVGVRVQGLDLDDQVLAIARLAVSRAGTGDFSPRAVDALFIEVGLPGPTKIGNNLERLKKRGLVRSGKSHGLWRVTPGGKASSEGS